MEPRYVHMPRSEKARMGFEKASEFLSGLKGRKKFYAGYPIKVFYASPLEATCSLQARKGRDGVWRI